MLGFLVEGHILCQRSKKGENVELSDPSLAQRSHPEPTVSVIDAPTCQEEQPLSELKEPLLTS